MDARLASEYRQARREEWNGLPMTPAKWAMVKARAEIRGWELILSAEQETWHGDYARHWRVDIGPGCWVDVWQVADSEPCDCWDWASDDGKEDDIPEHGHFGIVAETMFYGIEIAHDACWGFVWDWPGQSDARELTYAYDDIAGYAIRQARESFATMPTWVRDSMAIREEVNA